MPLGVTEDHGPAALRTLHCLAQWTTHSLFSSQTLLTILAPLRIEESRSRGEPSWERRKARETLLFPFNCIQISRLQLWRISKGALRRYQCSNPSWNQRIISEEALGAVPLNRAKAEYKLKDSRDLPCLSPCPQEQWIQTPHFSKKKAEFTFLSCKQAFHTLPTLGLNKCCLYHQQVTYSLPSFSPKAM